jgi:alpha/beta superfamily hydrolase
VLLLCRYLTKTILKRTLIMKTDTVKAALWGAVGGAVALAIVGFTWGGWVTGGSAELIAKTQSDRAVIAVLAPICASQFQKAPDAIAQQAVLASKSPWEQVQLVEASDWAKMPGTTKVAAGFGSACADLIVKLKLQ